MIPANAAGDPVNILVVDDRPENLLVTRATLDELGQRIMTARSGQEALKLLLEHEFAVILLDVNMPGMDGLETASFVRGRQRTAHTPIIFMTAYTEEMHTARGYSLGAVDYILTPVVPQVLRSKVKVFVELFQMTRQARRQADQGIALAREQAARAAAEDAIRRTAFLAEASDILSSSLDVGATAQALCRFVVPFLADVSALVLLDGHGQPTRTEVAWSGEAAGNSASLGRIDDSVISASVAEALATGNMALVAEPKPARERLAGTRADGTAAAIDLGFAVSSIAVLPLVARDRRLGALVLGLRAAERTFDATALALAEDLASRTAIALDNCLLYARIQEADQRKNQFLAMLAHELRNPLAPIRNAVQLLRMSGRGQADPAWAMEVIDRQTLQLVRLVDDLLDVARITQGRIVLKLEPVDVKRVVAVAMETSAPLVNSRRHAITVSVPDAPLHVHGDFSRIAQILSNLVNNAAKYTEPHGRIALTVEEEGAEVVFRVTDSGIGIAADMLAAIFDLFTQADSSLDRAQGGLGIGLTIVQRLVSMQGGSVRVHSSGPHRGSEFTVRLPRAAAAPAPQALQAAPQRQRTARRVLVVDDYLDSAESMATLLRIEGHEVKIAHDGLAAIELARTFGPDVIFLDIGLPGMNGYDVAKALRGAPATAGCALISVSGYGQSQDHERSRQSGFDRHLVKPVPPEILAEILDSLAAVSHG